MGNPPALPTVEDALREPFSSRLRRRAPAGLVALLALFLIGEPALDPRAPEPQRENGDPEGVPPEGHISVRVEVEGAEAGRVEIRDEAGGTMAASEGRFPTTLTAPPGPRWIIVESPGMARVALAVRLTGDRVESVRLEPGLGLSGQVRDPAGAPIAHAVVRVEAEPFPFEARVDEDGRFAFDTLGPGPYVVGARALGHAPSSIADVAEGSDAIALVLERIALVAGRVSRPDGAPGEGAEVVIAGSGLWPARRTEADAEGRFRFADVPPGVYEVRARLDRWVAEPRRGLAVGPGERSFLTFALVEGVTLSGRARDADDGTPLEGVEVTVSAESLDAAPRTARSGPDGAFRVVGLAPSPHQVAAFLEGYVPVTALPWEPGRALDLQLERGATLAGVVRDGQGRPLAGARVEVLGEAEGGMPVALDAATGARGGVFRAQAEPSFVPTEVGALEVTDGPVPPLPLYESPIEPEAPVFGTPSAGHFITDEQGRFRVTGVPPGRVQVTARHPGLAPRATDRLFVTAGMVIDDLELALAAAGTLRGRVIDDRGHGVGGVLVEARSDAEPYPRAVITDRDGHFELNDVFGALAITASPPGLPAVRARAEVGSNEEVEIELTVEHTLHALLGRAVDERGFPIGGAQLTLVTLRADAPFRRTLFSSPDGTFRAEGLPAPPWRVEGRAPNRASARMDVNEAGDEVSLVLPGATHLTGRVLDDRQNEGRSAEISLVREGLPPERRVTRSDAEGSFRLGGLQAGTWTLEARAEGLMPHSQAVEIVDRGRGPEPLELDPIRLAPAGSVEGTVVDALGVPVPRAEVRSGEAHTRARPDGTFTLEGVPPGRVEVHATHPAAGEGRADAIRVLAAQESRGVVIRLSERFDLERAESLPARVRGVAVELVARRGAVVISRVIPGSRAEAAGLRAGDHVLSIDGEPTTRSSDARRLRGPASVPALLVIERAGEEARLFVDRELYDPS